MAGCLLIFLPPYSPDFNLIEEAFSCREFCGRLSLCPLTKLLCVVWSNIIYAVMVTHVTSEDCQRSG